MQERHAEESAGFSLVHDEEGALLKHLMQVIWSSLAAKLIRGDVIIWGYRAGVMLCMCDPA